MARQPAQLPQQLLLAGELQRPGVADGHARAPAAADAIGGQWNLEMKVEPGADRRDNLHLTDASTSGIHEDQGIVVPSQVHRGSTHSTDQICP